MSALAVGILVAIVATVTALFGALVGAVIAGDARNGKLRESVDGACPACGGRDVIEFGPPSGSVEKAAGLS